MNGLALASWEPWLQAYMTAPDTILIWIASPIFILNTHTNVHTHICEHIFINNVL